MPRFARLDSRGILHHAMGRGIDRIYSCTLLSLGISSESSCLNRITSFICQPSDFNSSRTWQRNWLELLVYLYAHKASLKLSGKPDFMAACNELLGIYSMLPCSFAATSWH